MNKTELLDDLKALRDRYAESSRALGRDGYQNASVVMGRRAKELDALIKKHSETPAGAPSGHMPTCQFRWVLRRSEWVCEGAPEKVLQQLYQSCYVGQEPEWRDVPTVKDET